MPYKDPIKKQTAHKAWEHNNPEKWKTIHNKASRKYYANHAEKQMIYRQTHKDEKRVSDKAYREGPGKKSRLKKKRVASKIYRTRSEVRARNRAYYHEYKEHIKNNTFQRKYKITLESFYSILADQGGVCAICHSSDWGGRYRVPVVDHDHSSGFVRGILCCQCNYALGNLKNNPETAMAAAQYLRKFIRGDS